MDQSSTRESSLTLLEQAPAGDGAALDALLARYRPRPVRWARRRLPQSARDLADTEDLIQNALIKAIRNIEGFVSSGPTGFQNYLRLSVSNAIRDELRKASRRPAHRDR